VASAGPAAAVEFFDGALQIHGFYEMQTRILAQSFDTKDGYNLAQWWHIANVEVEWDAAPEGWGPFDFVSGFMRVEARYDCVWTAGCQMVPGYRNRYGNDARRLPDRISNARRSGLLGSIDPWLVETDDTGAVVQKIDYADTRRYIQVELGERAAVYGAPRPAEEGGIGGLGQAAPRPHHLGKLFNVPVLAALFFPTPGPNDVWGDADDPGFYVFEDFLDYEFAMKRLSPGNVGNLNNQILGPFRPGDKIPLPNVLNDRANPLRGPCPDDGMGGFIDDPSVCDVRPALGDPGDDDFVDAIPASAELPFRPGADVGFQQPGVPNAGLDTAQGLYLPNAGYRRLLERSDLRHRPDMNFTQGDLALNHGASQGPWNELKEAYFDLEMFDHQLWLRLGRQTIVWGKTELFRAQDQFNPQDVGLASLPSLEESRVPLWSIRGVWSFYDVGPLTDVRLEAAMNWDEFKPLDTGRCGEPFAPRPACTRGLGIFANALIGTGLAGELRPGYAWESYDALEGGVRLEFRYDRLSFAVTWWNGRNDTPYVKPVFAFERNVDPFSGRPRVEGGSGPCSAPGQPDCFGELVNLPDDAGNPAGLVNIDPLREALVRHHANLQLFTVICGATVTISPDLLPTACGFNAWNSVLESAEPDISDPVTLLAPTVSGAFSGLLAGQGPGDTVFPAGNLFNAVNGKSIAYTLARFDDIACGGDCNDFLPAGQSKEDIIPFAPLRDDGSQDYDGVRPTFPANFIPPPSPATSEDDAFFCLRYSIRLGVDCDLNPPPPVLGSTHTNYDLWRPVDVARYLDDEQEGVIGCGRFWGTDCDVDGFDLLNAEASAFFEAWPGIEGTEGGIWDAFGLQNSNNTNRRIRAATGTYLQPGTIDVSDPANPRSFYGTSATDPDLPICSRNTGAGRVMLPGCETLVDPGNPTTPVGFATDLSPIPANWGAVILPDADIPVLAASGHPFTGDPFRNELAALSWNALMSFVTLSVVSETNDDGVLPDGQICGDPGVDCAALNGLNDEFEAQGVAGRFDEFNPNDPFALDRCSFRNPILCRSLSALVQVSATSAKAYRAGGNGFFGRRDFVWHNGSQAVLDYKRRNIFGFAMDFAEDRTGTNWNVEFTWFNTVRFSDNNAFNLTNDSDTLNLVVSVDRPSFFRPLNRHRTFFLNAQVFVQAIPGWQDTFVSNGPVNALMTFSAFTGYYQDRLIPGMQVVYDVNSESGAFLWSLGYRITQNFLLQIGLNAFWGSVQSIDSPVEPIGTTGVGIGRGMNSQQQFVENGLSAVRHRDEIFLRLRWTF